jgi:allantoinase
MDVIRGGRAITSHGPITTDIGIEDGRIAKIGDLSGAGRTLVDAAGRYVVPGTVDAHVHIALDDDDNFQPLIETLVATSRSAVLGGTTTLMAYVRGGGSTTAEQALRRELVNATGSYADYGFHLQLRPTDDIAAAIAAGRSLGVMGYKIMLAYPEKGVMLSDERLFEALEELAREDDILLVHPDDGAVVAVLEQRERRTSRPDDNGAYLRSSPGVLEAAGMVRVAYLSRLTGTRVHFVHLSAKESVDAATWLRAGPDRDRLSWETQPHYALLTDQAVLDRGALAKIGPPLREEADRRAVLAAIRSGVVGALTSDHAPRTAEMKLATADIFSAPHGGLSGAETLLRLAGEIAEGSDEDAFMVDLTRLTATTSARTFGLHPRKGSIELGADADLVVVDRDSSPAPVRVEDLHQTSDYSLYEGIPVRLRVHAVVKNGTLLARDGELLAEPGGVYLRRTAP